MKYSNLRSIQYKGNHPRYAGAFISLSACLLVCCSCKKFVEIGVPDTRIVSQTVFTTDASATAAIVGIYVNMMSNQFTFTTGGTTLYAGLSSDEFRNYSATAFQNEFYTNSINPANNTINTIWNNAYSFIYDANAVLEGLASSSGVSAPVKNQLEGEAKFIRAFSNFYLTNFFGDIPLVMSTDYRVNAVIPRTKQADVYKQIEDDLISAQTLLSADYSFCGGERVRPTKWAATALLARVYLYTNDWKNAEIQSGTLINNNNYHLLSNLNTVFLKNSIESILQFYPVRPGVNTNEGSSFILTAAPGGSGVGISISDNLFNSFETGDTRKSNWIKGYTGNGQTYYYPFKYKVNTSTVLTEYYTVLRLSEQYLIRAEARAAQDNLTGALDDLNSIRTRAGLPNSLANDKLSILTAILHERQVELFAEWGHRWFDLKRTNTIDSVMNTVSAQKGGSWSSYKAFYPIPVKQIQNNPATIQNTGY